MHLVVPGVAYDQRGGFALTEEISEAEHLLTVPGGVAAQHADAADRVQHQALGADPFHGATNPLHDLVQLHLVRREYAVLRFRGRGGLHAI